MTTHRFVSGDQNHLCAIILSPTSDEGQPNNWFVFYPAIGGSSGGLFRKAKSGFVGVYEKILLRTDELPEGRA